MVPTKIILFLHLVVLSSCGKLASRSILLDTLQQQTQNVLTVANQALGSVENLTDTVFQNVEGLTSDLSTELGSIVTNLTNEINGAVEEATNAGVDTTNCVGDSVTRITSLSGDLLQNATGCLFTQYDAVKRAVTNVVELIESVTNNAAEVDAKIATCKSNTVTLLQDLCLVQVQASVNIGGLLTGITIEAAKVTTLATTTIGSLGKCTVDITATLTDKGNDIVQGVLGCINNLFSF